VLATPDALKILLVEDDEDDYVLTRELLEEVPEQRYELRWVTTLPEAIRALGEAEFDAVLLDFRLGEQSGLELLTQLGACPHPPVIMLTGQSERSFDLQAMQAGAADFLVKSQIDSRLLERAIRYACERERLLRQIQAMSLGDELTGLYNRRGFFTLADQQLRLVRRHAGEMVLFYVDLDGMKPINDLLGHRAGDAALVEAAEVLRTCFRTTDIVARIGGDEFVALALGVGESGEAVIRKRLQGELDARNAQPGRAFRLELSIGTACLGVDAEGGIDALLARADAAMYEEKQKHHARRSG